VGGLFHFKRIKGVCIPAQITHNQAMKRILLALLHIGMIVLGAGVARAALVNGLGPRFLAAGLFLFAVGAYLGWSDIKLVIARINERFGGDRMEDRT
jgi:hypothetical protein